jgi:hypothetical protein
MTTVAFEGFTERGDLPAIIIYQGRVDQKVGRCWSFFQAILQKIGELLRNAFYLPLYSKKVIPIAESTARIAKEEVDILKQSDAFSMQDIVIRRQGSEPQDFNVRVLESRQIGEKTLRIILFSFNGNDKHQRWEPLTIRELSETPHVSQNN